MIHMIIAQPLPYGYCGWYDSEGNHADTNRHQVSGLSFPPVRTVTPPIDVLTELSERKKNTSRLFKSEILFSYYIMMVS